jgi:poly(hydroxyalkanoate) granule-associated protein
MSFASNPDRPKGNNLICAQSAPSARSRTRIRASLARSSAAATSRESRLREIPQDVIHRGRGLAGFGREIWLAGLGAVAVIDKEGAEVFERLVERGKAVDARGRQRMSEGRDKVAQAFEENLYDPLVNALRRVGVSTSEEIHPVAPQARPPGAARRARHHCRPWSPGFAFPSSPPMRESRVVPSRCAADTTCPCRIAAGFGSDPDMHDVCGDHARESGAAGLDVRRSWIATPDWAEPEELHARERFTSASGSASSAGS